MAASKRPAVVITGASSGVGRALARALAPSFACVALVSRHLARLADTGDEVEREGSIARRFVADLATPDGALNLATELRAAFESISVLAHCAGVLTTGEAARALVEDFDRTVDVNLRAPYLLTRELLAPLVTGNAHVVFINSSVVGQRRAGLAAYAASKHGLCGVADSLRQELNPRGVRVLSVFLGAVATPMRERLHAESGLPYQPERLLQPDDVAEIIRCAVSLPSGAEVTDLHIRPSVAHRMSEDLLIPA